MTKCAVCDKEAVCFTELYDNDRVFRKTQEGPGIYTVFLCEGHHKMMLRNIRNDLIRMQWNRAVRE